jgi:hypothetical protein
MHGAGAHRAEAGEIFKEIVGGAGFGAEFSFFPDADEFRVFKIAPVLIDDFSMREECVRGVADAAPVAVVAEDDVGRVVM